MYGTAMRLLGDAQTVEFIEHIKLHHSSSCMSMDSAPVGIFLSLRAECNSLLRRFFQYYKLLSLPKLSYRFNVSCHTY